VLIVKRKLQREREIEREKSGNRQKKMTNRVEDVKRFGRRMLCDTSAGVRKGMVLAGVRLGCACATIFMLYSNLLARAKVGLFWGDEIHEETIDHDHAWVSTLWYNSLLQSLLII